MFSTILTIRKRSDISREEFIEYYEKKHTAVIAELIPSKAILFRRNYVIDDDPLTLRLAEGRGSDTELGDIAVITEGRFENREDAEEVIEAFLEKDTLDQILADEENFIAPGGVRWTVVEVHE
jgi:hypothetical protein